jgi:hypothetical protein
MCPCVLGGFDLKAKPFQPLLFVHEIPETDLECDVVDGGSYCVCSAITGTLGAIKQGEKLSMPAVAVCNLEERAVGDSDHERQADDLLVETSA